jgi:hypothetical protein
MQLRAAHALLHRVAPWQHSVFITREREGNAFGLASRRHDATTRIENRLGNTRSGINPRD